MSNEKILVVEDGPDISSLLKLYFTAQGYEVLTATRGKTAVELCKTNPPNLALLDVGLPDMDGYEVGKAIRAGRTTRHIPIIFLTAHGERKDRLKGLGEVQAQYYIVKPFDIEEVHTIVKNLLEEARRKNQRHPVTDLPTAELISDHLRSLIHTDGWSLAMVRINGFEQFTQIYGSVVGEDVLKFVAQLLHETLDTVGSDDDFIGQIAVGPDFIITAAPERLKAICEQLITRFDEGISVHYAYRDRKRGYIEVPDDNGEPRQFPFMTLSIVVLTAADGQFSDIRMLTETVEEIRSRHQSADDKQAKSVVQYAKQE